MADSSHARGDDPRVDRDVLPVVAIRRRSVSHAPDGAAVAEDDVANIATTESTREGPDAVDDETSHRRAGSHSRSRCLHTTRPRRVLTVTRFSSSSPAFFKWSTADRIVRPSERFGIDIQ